MLCDGLAGRRTSSLASGALICVNELGGMMSVYLSSLLRGVRRHGSPNQNQEKSNNRLSLDRLPHRQDPNLRRLTCSKIRYRGSGF